MKKVSLLVVLLAFISKCFAQVSFKHFQTLDEMLNAAKEEQKFIFIDAYTDWCGWCKVLDQKVFSDKSVGDSIHRYFIPVKMEMEKEELGYIISLKFAVNSYPQALIINPNGELVDIINGYSPLENYKKSLTYAIAKTKSKEIIKGYSNNYKLKYPNFYVKGFKSPSHKKELVDSVTVNKFLTQQKDWNNEVVWNILNKHGYSLNQLNKNKFNTQLNAYKALFGDERATKVYMIVFNKDFDLLLLNPDEDSFKLTLAQYLKSLNNNWWYQYYFTSSYYEKHNNYAALTYLTDSVIKHTELKEYTNQINETAWNLYKTCEDKALLKIAINWMKDYVLLNDPAYNFIDTYAALLYKTGNYTAAKNQALLAIKVGKADGEDVAGTEKLLLKIEEALASPK